MGKSGFAGKRKDLRESVKDTVGYRRIISLFDQGSFQEIDPLALSCGGPAEAVAGFGTVEGRPACAFSQNGSVAGGAMSKAQASKIRKTYRLALKTGCPIVGIYDSIGARLDERADMLAACGDILLDANNLSGVVPQISMVLGPCTGTQAMIAAGVDLVVMSGQRRTHRFHGRRRRSPLRRRKNRASARSRRKTKAKRLTRSAGCFLCSRQTTWPLLRFFKLIHL